MDIRVLQYFLAVAQEQSITRAAEALHMTQPPLSRAMRELEEELGVTLLVRHAKSVTLTEEGMLLRDRAEGLVTLFERTREEVASGDGVQGEVSIGCGESESITLLARAAKRLRDRHPLVRFRLFTGDAERVLDKLDRGVADFGLLVDPSVDGERYELLRMPAPDCWGVIVAAAHSLAAREVVTPEELRGEPLFLPHQAFIRSSMLAWLGVTESEADVAGYYDMAFNASRFAREGIGCVLGLGGIVHAGEESGIAFVPFEPPLPANLYLVWRRYQVLTKPALAYLEELRREIGQ